MSFLHIPGLDELQTPLRFELQPITDAELSAVFGYELLYRGTHPADWGKVDMAVLCAIADLEPTPQQLFINLSNETILKHSLSEFVPASKRDQIFFELSEAHIANDGMMQIADRINQLTRQGLHFALDDFGSGLDGMLRLSVLEHIAVIKLDRLFLKYASLNQRSEASLALLIKHWRNRGIKVIAEGIETADELAFARRIGANYLQGFFIDARLSNFAYVPQPPLARPAAHSVYVPYSGIG